MMPSQRADFRQLYRSAFELNAALAWTLSALASLYFCLSTQGLVSAAAVGIAAASAALAWWRARQGWAHYCAKAALTCSDPWTITPAALDAQVQAGGARLWLGKGFRWSGRHTELAMQIQRVGLHGLLPPRWALRLMGKAGDPSQYKGEAWIHGLQAGEQNISIPWEHGEGNWTLFGTSGAGKTRLYELLAHQIIRRGEVLIVFDPKYDKELRQTLIDSCRSAGRHEAFCEFHPAFPERSVRIDCTKNFSRATEIASRIADMLGGTVHDSFTAFGWRVLQAITHGLLYLGERPTLKKLREHMESGPEVLLERCLLRFFQRSDPAGWEDRVRRQEERNAAPGQPSRPKSASARQRALVQLYRQAEAAAQCVPELTELIALTEHPREHYHKMLAGVLPLLTQLTAASLGELLSPDHEADDEREILDMEKLIREQRVLYVATDSLVDGTVGSAIAAVLLGELRAVAGARYNHGTDAQTRVHILCDEACELVTPSLIALMSKGRGAGMICYLATQTFSDYVWKFGSEDAARMVLGNGNNRLCLRVVDSKTQAYMAEGFGETTVRRSASSVSVSGRAREPGAELHGLNRSQSETTAPLFPGHLLGQLPDLHYVAALSGAKVYKGRIPRIVRHAQTR